MRALSALGSALCCLILACTPVHTFPNSLRINEPAKPLPVDAWPFRPYSIAIHPLSYFPEPNWTSSQPEITNIEIYVECLDQDGQATRTPGVFYLEVQDPQSKAVSSFQADLSDLVQNYKYWDSVMKCYRFLVPIPSGFHCAGDLHLNVEADVNLGFGTLLKTTAKVACPNHQP
ncbi:MAG: hypothetical protein K8R92_06570 [Planctomycetes bacterium]|nr:hypothetical protein [Planctomycetota bacterium]